MASLSRRCMRCLSRAIVPLTLFLLIVLFLILRERLTRPDEVVLGILFGIIGMLLFNIGIELGLQRLGNGVGSTLPALFKKIELTDSRKVINGFDTAAVQTALKPEGGQERFFMVKEEEDYIQIPFDAASYDTLNKSYIFTPSRGPLYGSRNILLGLIVVFLFAFVIISIFFRGYLFMSITLSRKWTDFHVMFLSLSQSIS